MAEVARGAKVMSMSLSMHVCGGGGLGKAQTLTILWPVQVELMVFQSSGLLTMIE
jgi:hypothetical protein